MQKGFASLEIILVVLIIALLATVAVPNTARLVDRVSVSYEQKRLYSELQYLRTLDRSATVVATGTNMTDFFSSRRTLSKKAEMEIDLETNSYQILREYKPVRERHYLSNGVTFSVKTDVPEKIDFDSWSYSSVKSKKIVLTSRLGKELTVVFDSVGRIRGGD